MDLTLYHGSEKIVRSPSLEAALPHNDFGPGFYCTLDEEMAKEWACKRKHDGYANRYTLRTKGLKTLDLLCGSYNVLHWIALLLANRTFDLRGDLAPAVRSLVIERYLLDLSTYDVVVGYRADDSYFQYAQDFVEGALSVQNLGRALRLGNLGEQTVLVSERAFRAIKFEEAHAANSALYYPKFMARDTTARQDYRGKVVAAPVPPDALYAADIARGGVEVGDARIPTMLR